MLALLLEQNVSLFQNKYAATCGAFDNAMVVVWVYRRFVELPVLLDDIAFKTSSCSVLGGSERMSVVVDRCRSLSETAEKKVK